MPTRSHSKQISPKRNSDQWIIHIYSIFPNSQKNSVCDSSCQSKQKNVQMDNLTTVFRKSYQYFFWFKVYEWWHTNMKNGHSAGSWRRAELQAGTCHKWESVVAPEITVIKVTVIKLTGDASRFQSSSSLPGWPYQELGSITYHFVMRTVCT